MGEVKQVFTSDITDLENKLGKLQAEYLKLKDAVKSSARASKEDGGAVAGWIHDQAKELVKTVTGLFAVRKGIDFVVEGYSQWNERMRSLAEASNKFHQDMLSQMAQIGAATNVGKIEDWQKTVIASGAVKATKGQLTAAYLGAAGGAPTASLARQEEIAAAAANAAALFGGKEEDIKGFAATMGRVGTIAPGKTGTQLANLVMTMRGKVGMDSEQLLSREFLGGIGALVESGAVKSPEEALAVGLVALQKKMSPEFLGRAAAQVSAPLQPKQSPRGQRPKPEDVAFNRFVAAGPQERWGMLFSDPNVARAVLGEEAGARIGRISSDEVAAVTGQLRGAAGMTEAMAGLEGSAAGRTSLEQQNLAYRGQRAKLTPAAQANLGEAKRRLEEQEKLESGMEARGSAWYTRFGARTVRNLYYLQEDVAPLAQDVDPRIGGLKLLLHALQKLHGAVTTNQATNAATNAAATSRE